MSADDSGEGGGDGAPTARADPSSEGEEEEESGAGIVGIESLFLFSLHVFPALTCKL